MTLIIEDGSIVTGADSYQSLVDARLLAANYGLALPEDDIKAEVSLRNGAGYIDLQEGNLCGSRVSAEQSLCYPRKDVSMHGFPISSESIPLQVKLAQMYAAVEYGAGTDVRASSDGRETSLERVEGAVTVEYFQGGGDGSNVTITKAIDALGALICSGGNNGFSFNVDRG